MFMIKRFNYNKSNKSGVFILILNHEVKKRIFIVILNKI